MIINVINIELEGNYREIKNVIKKFMNIILPLTPWRWRWSLLCRRDRISVGHALHSNNL